MKIASAQVCTAGIGSSGANDVRQELGKDHRATRVVDTEAKCWRFEFFDLEIDYDVAQPEMVEKQVQEMPCMSRSEGELICFS